MDLVLCHTTADFDTLGAAVGVSCLRPGSRIVLTGGAHPTVQRFLSLWRDQYPLIDRRAVVFDQVRSLTLVDASWRDRFSPVSDWLQQAETAGLPIDIYDHHDPHTLSDESPDDICDIPSAKLHIEAVGAATTLIVEALQHQGIVPTAVEATAMALGIHSDTGSLTFEQTTSRDAAALAWLMAQGAVQSVIAENSEPALSSQLQDLLGTALETIETERVRGHYLGWVRLRLPSFLPGLSALAEQLMAVLGLDTLLLYASYPLPQANKAVVIGRSHTNLLLPHSSIDLRPIFQSLGGGGHAQAASALLKSQDAQTDSLRSAFERVLAEVRSQIPQMITAKALMSSPVRTILPTTSVDEAQRVLLRYGHTGLCVVNQATELVGIISRRDVDIALRHGLGHAPVKGCMNVQIKSIAPETPITEIQSLIRTHDIGRLPVLADGALIGIVTRTDLLRQIHPDRSAQQLTNWPVDWLASQPEKSYETASDLAIAQTSLNRPPAAATLYQQLKNRIREIWPVLQLIATAADRRGWTLYIVGGAVRDLLLSLLSKGSLSKGSEPAFALTDIDLVVDGAETGAGMTLAKSIQSSYPNVTVQVHGQFQTASLIWHPHDAASPPTATSPETIKKSDTETWHSQSPLLIDIATARTEFYPYPAANPEVEASTIRQDLYRRDFTINAMAMQMNGSQPGHLLDFFGGWIDLQQRHIRVLHANSFIEDPTRIFRAVRFAARLGFAIEAQSEQFIRYALSSGVYTRMLTSADKTPALQTRLKAELKYLLTAPQWEVSLAQIEHLGAWACLHSSLKMSPDLWKQLRRMDRWLIRFEVDQPRWLMLLALIIAQLEPADRASTALNLELDARSRYRLENLHLWEADLLTQIPQADKPSQIYRLLQPYAHAALLLMGDRHPRQLGPKIWQYVVRHSQMPPLINGATLKRLGYQPGPQFRGILAAVHYASLNGEVTTAQAAEAYVVAHYPL